MKDSRALDMMLIDLLNRWEGFVDEARQRAATHSEYEQGFVEGFEAAFNEVRLLFAQVNGLPSQYQDDSESDIDFVLRPDTPKVAQDAPLWEYLYVTFDQDATGYWHVRDVSGLHTPIQHPMPSFNEAVQFLREDGGWRLTNFAKGIHVFRRPAKT